MEKIAGISVVAATLAVSGCSPHKVTANPPPPVQVIQAYSARSSAPPPKRWWRDFGESQLNALVSSALAQNFELRAAFARMKQANALAAQAGAVRWPSADLSFSAGRSETRSPFADADLGEFGGFSLDSLPEVFTANQFKASLAAAYEVDIWNKLGSSSKAAALDALAAQDSAEGTAITLVSRVSDAYFNLVLQKATRRLLTEQLEVNQTFLELTNLRFKQGFSSALDIYQQQQLVVNRRGQLAVTAGAIEVLENQLAVLTGRSPRTLKIDAPDVFSKLPLLPGLGIPADLLDRRPDVRAARRRVEAADYRVAVAVADRLPGLRLTGSLSMVNGDITELISRPLYAIGASILGPIFDAGRRKAEVVRTRAVVEEALANYGQTLLVAVSEVENALVQERQQERQISALRRQVEINGNALREARTRYREGLSTFLPVLTALQTEQATQLTFLQARRQLIGYRLQLLRALGGTWTKKLNPGSSKKGAK